MSFPLINTKNQNELLNLLIAVLILLLDLLLLNKCDKVKLVPTILQEEIICDDLPELLRFVRRLVLIEIGDNKIY